MSVFNICLKRNENIINKALDTMLPGTDIPPERLHEAMRYSVFAGGKRLRPSMVMEAAKLCGMSHEKVLLTSGGIEMIHTYSLIHDDLPSMDNDDIRRGIPTCHKIYGDAMAVLAGDALLTEAFRCFSDNASVPGISGVAVLDVIKKLSEACGSRGMAGGQALDIHSARSNIDEKTLYYICQNKTGALISASIWAGCRLAEASADILELMLSFGEKIGLLFQIVDDILDVTGNEEILGKPVGSDLKNMKNTFPTIFGYDESQRLMKHIAEDAKDQLSGLNNADFFLEMVDFILTRQS